jgi:signal transduction histidine kinase
MPTPIPINEAARLEALRQYHVLDTAREREFDDLVWLAARICETPIALVSLVDQHRLWFKGRYGLEVTETPRHDSFCAHAILGAPKMLIVPDATQDERFAGSDLVKGEPYIQFYAGAPLVTPEGQAVGTLCLLDLKPRELTDIQKTALRIVSDQVMNQLELRRRLDELGRTSDDLRAANKELEGFSHVISHDLRGPLRAITSFAEILRARHASQLTTRGMEMLGQIEQISGGTAATLEAFLGLLRLKKQPLHKTSIDMKELVENVVREVQMQSAGPPVRVTVGPLPGAWGDQAQLHQVWVNLVSNALKFSRGRTPPVIEIGGKEEADRLVYFVKDNGTGFEMNEAKQLWTAFGRLHGSEIEGTGLGLSIVRGIVARHGGTVWAEGATDRGATFHFALPKPATNRPGATVQSQQAA